MADNVTADPGSGGATFASDDIGGVQYPRTKVTWGPDGTATDTNTGASALPIQDGGNSITVDGSVTAVPGSGATSLGKAEDAPAASADVGVVALAVRKDTVSVGSDTDGDYSTLNVNASGRLYTSATVDAALPAGTNAIGKLAANDGVDIGDVTINNASGGSAVNIQDGGNSITVDASSLPLPTGASTLAEQQTQTTSLQLIDDVVHADDASRSKSALMGAVFDDVATTTITENNAGYVRMSSRRALLVEGVASGTAIAVTEGSAASILTSVQLIDDPVIADDAAFTPATSKVMMAGFEADESSTDSVDEGDAGAARMTLDRKVIVTHQPHTAGGLSIFRSLDIDETEEDVKTSAGQVYGMWVTNTATATRFVKFYNDTAANVIVGTTTPVITIGIPGNSSDDVSGNFGPGGTGIAFGTAICVAATTGVADADTGAPGANDVIINVFYK